MKHNMQLKKLFIMFFFIFGVYVSIISNNANAQNKKYSTKDMPASVLETFKKTFPNATAIGYDLEKEKGVTSYEIESKEGDIRRDILFNADGTIDEVEQQINVSELPEKIVSSINTKYSNAKIIKAERITKGSETLYEVTFKKGKKKHTVELNENGDIIEG